MLLSNILVEENRSNVEIFEEIDIIVPGLGNNS